MLTGLHFRSDPGDEIRGADIEFLLADETSHFETPLIAILLGYHDPAVIVLFVFRQQLFKGRCIYCKLGADAVCPEILDKFYSGCAEDCRVEAGYKDIALFQ